MSDELFEFQLGLAGLRIRPINHPAVAINYEAPATSIDAGVKAKKNSGKQREAIYAEIKKMNGLTADEISVILGLPAQSVSARINGLHKDGHIVDSGDRRTTRYGRKAIVWVLI